MFLHGRGFYAGALALSLLLVTACGSTSTVTVVLDGGGLTGLPSMAISQGAHHQVLIQNATFAPLEISIKPGDTVTWVNHDGGPHTATSIRYFQDEDDISHVFIGESWDSGYIEPGQSFSRTFDTEGTFEYFSFPLDKPLPVPEFYQLMSGMALGVVVVK
jgi:plastocyanin